jgi:endonuclease/exonuclease/phosphatase family metal-dependent hydrolase
MKILYAFATSLSLVFISLMSCGSTASPQGEISVETGCFTAARKDHTIQSEGGELLVELRTYDSDISALSSKSWCTPKVIAKDGKDYVQITLQPHTGKSARSAGVILSSGDNCPNVELTIRQEGVSEEDDPDKGERLTLKIASYNIRYAAAADAQTGNGWDARKLHVADVIKNHDFDIVGTQEGNKAQLADLKGYLPDFDYVGHPYGGSSNTSHNCAIFYKTAKYTVMDEGCFWFSETPDIPSIGWDATDQRICYWAKFRELETGTEFYFFTAHFYWRYQTARENSGAVLVAKIREIAGDAPVISTGDYNSTSTTPQINTILTLLKDAYDTTETPPIGPKGTDLGGGVFQGEPRGRIDYIFVSNHFRVLNYAVLTDSYNNGRHPSDHLPVSSQLSISL